MYHREVLVHPDQQYAENRGGAHQTRAALRQVAQVIPPRALLAVVLGEPQDSLAGFDDHSAVDEDVLLVLFFFLLEEGGGGGGVPSELFRGVLGDQEGVRRRRSLVDEEEGDEQQTREEVRQQEVDDESGNRRETFSTKLLATQR